MKTATQRTAMLFLAIGLLLFVRLGSNGLFDLDEALYAESAREMNLHSDWVLPTVANKPFFEKPPLVYWETIVAYRLFGRSEWTTRLPSAMAVLGTAMLIFWLGKRWFSRRAAWIAATAFVVSPVVFGAARQLTMDATLTLCITAAVAAAVQLREAATSRKFVWAVLFWFCISAGILCKGLPGILFPIAIILIHDASSEGWNLRTTWTSIKRMQPLMGLVVLGLVAAPWHVIAWRLHGSEFVDEYIVRQHLGRFRGGDTAHRAPIWFYLPGFLLGALPWSVFSISAMRRSVEVSKPASGEIDPHKLLLIWSLTVITLFSISGSKLISYILPMYPAAALLVAAWLDREIDRVDDAKSRRTWYVLGSAVLVVSELAALILWAREPIMARIEAAIHKPVRVDQIPPGMWAFALHLVGAMAIGAFAFVLLARMRKRVAAVACMFTGAAMALLIAIGEGLPVVDDGLLAPLHNAARMAASQSGRLFSPVVIVYGGPRRPSALFYLQDKLFDRAHSRVTEAQSVEDAGRMVDSILSEEGRAVVLTDSKSVALLRANRTIQAYYDHDGWAVLTVIR